jgi:hypothetical protein
MAKKEPKAQGTGLDPCTACGGVECGTGRIKTCCEACSH